MNGTPPEANNEYSRAHRTSSGRLPRPRGGDSHALELHEDRTATALAAGALLAAVVLVAAEFTNLYTVAVIGRVGPVASVTTGSHNDYALIPIALLVAVLALALRRGAGRPALLALGALAIITLVIALLADLPAAHRTGLIAAGARYEVGKANPSVGFYLETLGAVMLLTVVGSGLLAGAGAAGGPAVPRPVPPPLPDRARPADGVVPSPEGLHSDIRPSGRPDPDF